MESLSTFMREVYVTKPDSRLTVKEIYEDFRAWIIRKYDTKTWNKISQRQVYTALKYLSEYSYVRYKEGYCLKGIAYREEKAQTMETNVVQPTTYLALNILEPTVESPNGITKIQHTCPRIQGVVLPTLGHKK